MPKPTLTDTTAALADVWKYIATEIVDKLATAHDNATRVQSTMCSFALKNKNICEK